MEDVSSFLENPAGHPRYQTRLVGAVEQCDQGGGVMRHPVGALLTLSAAVLVAARLDGQLADRPCDGS